MKDNRVHIVGAGPAGLVAAINLARCGYDVVIHEQNSDAGGRFNGDFQGLENWSTKGDVLEFLKNIGVDINFRCDPYSKTHYFGPDLQEITVKTSRPLFYLVERGKSESSLDRGLKRQALALGVKILWNDKLEIFPSSGRIIVGTGPKAADAIARGIVFKTSHPDFSAGFLDNRIAPKAYAYLLVNDRKATFATCLFQNFPKEKIFFQRALESMRSVIDIDIRDPKEFGGYVNFFLNPPPVKNDGILYVGENAGFQDALWGFGLRYAMLSGYLAAISIERGQSYPGLCKQYITPLLETSLANRWLFAHLGNFGYRLMLNRMSRVKDAVGVLRRFYQPSVPKALLFRIARQWYKSRLLDKHCMHGECDCVWCRHGKTAHMDRAECLIN